MKEAIIFDIDGTLADCTHRLHHVAGSRKDYAAFYQALAQDAAYPAITFLYTALEHKLPILLVSGRPNDYREATTTWLFKHQLSYTRLYMRKAGDFRQDALIKAEILDQIIADGFKPLLAVDDRKRVVDMWRSRGITCLQCREWSEDDPLGGTDEASRAKGKLTIMVGPVCAGKSTYAKALTLGTLTPIVSTDNLRQELTGNYADQHCNDQVYRAAHAIIAARIQHGLPCVFDATNLRRRDRLALVALAKGGPVEYIVMDRSLLAKMEAACMRMDATSKPDWITITQRSHERMGSCLKDILKGDGQANVTVLDRRST